MKNYKTPSIIAISVFIICMLSLFLGNTEYMDNVIYIVSGTYALMCLAFLAFQLYAFVQAHAEYNEDIEEVKYDVFEAEGVEYTDY